MAVATKDSIQDSEAQGKLRQAVTDLRRQLTSGDAAELTQARETLERLAVKVHQECRRLAMPLPGQAPRLTGQDPPPTPERLEQLAKIDHVVALLESARLARADANVALFALTMR